MSRASRLRQDYGDLSSEDVAGLDAAAAACGVSVIQLMEVAGWQVARWIFEARHSLSHPILVVAGHGNNGGDGLVAARHLRAWGLAVQALVVAAPDRLGEITSMQVRAAQGVGIEVGFAPSGEVAAGLLEATGTVVDALLGTGVRGDPREAQARIIARLPAGRTISIDVPSGLDASTGDAGSPAVQAARTCTLTAMKRGLWTATGRARAGEITVADIGMPEAAWHARGLAPPGLVRGSELLLVPTDTG